MLGNTSDPTNAQSRLIESLQARMLLETIPKPRILSAKKPVHFFRCGRGTIADHLKIMNKYVCVCGSQVDQLGHSTALSDDGMALDSYSLACMKCGATEEVNFMSLRDVLEVLSDSELVADRRFITQV